MNKMKINSEMIVAISAIVVGVCALFVSIYEVNILRDQQKASVWPYLEFSYNSNENGFSYNIKNKGVGPALVKWVTVRYDNEPIKQWKDYIIKVFNSDTIVYATSFINTRVIAPNEKIVMIKISDRDHAGLAAERHDKLGFQLCYGSVYDDNWLIKRDSSGTTRMKTDMVDVDPEIQFWN